MSLQWNVAMPERSACSTRPSGSSRRTLRSTIETTSIRPSGSQPSPDGWVGTSTTVVTSPSIVTALTAWS